MTSPQILTSASQTEVLEITPDDKKDPAQDAEHLESQKQIDSAFDTKYASECFRLPVSLKHPAQTSRPGPQDRRKDLLAMHDILHDCQLGGS